MSTARLQAFAAEVTPEQLSLYRVPLATITHLTALDFAVLSDRATHVNKLRADDEPRLIRTLSNLSP
ncbi:hypothetical protein [Sporichthya sp.]|uniref:hypothetical protein n=1 Tax=Sporichthya sp. TaxID=65475 RepID=UPI0018020D08|nr:hypothetical protein [Sporichthya sp.]MBA3741820.1 hypothetical protein [Sporichthya sp.]